jgi:predicted ribosomally synthesized peptide with SipW-like signal peptide
MLIGTTFAWFTDSVSSGKNTITAGNLKIEAYYQDVGAGGLTYNLGSNFTRTTDHTVSFKSDTVDIENGKTQIINEDLWEPGKVGAKLITVKNVGTLTANVKLSFALEDTGLQDALWFDFIQVDNTKTTASDRVTGTFTPRAMSTLNDLASQVELPIKGTKSKNETLSTSRSFILVYGMNEEAGNEYQNKTFSATVNILATQYTDESDSFGTDYDENATYDGSSTVKAEADKATELTATPAGTSTTISATVPSGAVDAGTSLTLNATYKGSDPSIVKGLAIKTGDENQTIDVYDINVDGLATENTSVVTVQLNVGPNLQNLMVYHKSTAMTALIEPLKDSDNPTDGTYYYDSAKGVLYIYTTSFSNYTVTSGTTIGVSNAEQLENAVAFAAEGSTIKLANNITSESPIPVKSSGETKIDLNGKTLESKYISTDQGVTISVEKDTKLIIENGNLKMYSDKPSRANINVKTGGSVEAKDLKITSTGSVFFPCGDAASVTVDNCIVNAVAYCVGTNAATTKNYKVKISLKDSTFTSTRPESYSSPRDNCAVMINVEGTLDIDHCTIIGERQGVIVRAGTATIKDSTIKTLGKYSKPDQYYTGSWGSGNEVPAAALVVGNDEKNKGSYLANAVCTLTNTNIYAESDFAKIYMESSTNQYTTTLNYTGGNVDNSFLKLGGNPVTVNGNTLPATSTSEN